MVYCSVMELTLICTPWIFFLSWRWKHQTFFFLIVEVLLWSACLYFFITFLHFCLFILFFLYLFFSLKKIIVFSHEGRVSWGALGLGGWGPSWEVLLASSFALFLVLFIDLLLVALIIKLSIYNFNFITVAVLLWSDCLYFFITFLRVCVFILFFLYPFLSLKKILVFAKIYQKAK